MSLPIQFLHLISCIPLKRLTELLELNKVDSGRITSNRRFSLHYKVRVAFVISACTYAKPETFFFDMQSLRHAAEERTEYVFAYPSLMVGSPATFCHRTSSCLVKYLTETNHSLGRNMKTPSKCLEVLKSSINFHGYR
jgi:hypothetical protein